MSKRRNMSARYRSLDTELALSAKLLMLNSVGDVVGWDIDDKKKSCLCADCRRNNQRKALYWHLERYYKGYKHAISRLHDSNLRTEALKIICLRTLNGKATHR